MLVRVCVCIRVSGHQLRHTSDTSSVHTPPPRHPDGQDSLLDKGMDCVLYRHPNDHFFLPFTKREEIHQLNTSSSEEVL